MSKFKKQLPINLMKNEKKNIRTFSYSIADTNLGFQLSCDTDEQAKRFLEMLKQASIDVALLIEEINADN